ncbi:hypothetical protein Trydic_g5538, partial [Trypoxylus dichotomus]
MSELNRNISKFWEIETIPERHIFSAEENRCEQHFHATAQRDTSGRFVVSLPFKENVNSLGASYDQALKRFYSLEKRLNKNPPLKQEYGEFIKEYLELGHMRKAKLYNYSTEPHFYLPHHAVVKENSITTRLRVVFDGSAKTSSGVSLNDTLMVGPKLQQDLFDIVCRFRLYAYVITADVAKMYRQVRINEQCMPFQRILWRMSDKSDVEIFELTAVTYGTASASYLATKVLQQLAMAKQDAQPFGAEIILRDFYVDDLLTGAQTIDQANKIIAEVTEILSQGKLELRKWASNKPELLQNIPETCCGNTLLDLDKSDNIKKRLNKNPPLKQEYGEFIKEYLELGHMRKAKLYNYSTEPHFYLPHHAVVKENSITTRLRVVFDGSAKTSSGVSLNDTLMVGPKLQQDLFDIVCRFRLYAYVITADVAKMYRQVRINEQCMPFQRILWRMSDKSDVEIFELTAVTYGTASASYLATKVLQQLAMAKQDAQPFGAEIILRDFYVDDLLTGAQTIDQANKIIAEVTEILSQGKLELRKWASNKPELLQNIPETCCGNTLLDLDKSDNI